MGSISSATRESFAEESPHDNVRYAEVEDSFREGSKQKRDIKKKLGSGKEGGVDGEPSVKKKRGVDVKSLDLSKKDEIPARVVEDVGPVELDPIHTKTNTLSIARGIGGEDPYANEGDDAPGIRYIAPRADNPIDTNVMDVAVMGEELSPIEQDLENLIMHDVHKQGTLWKSKKETGKYKPREFKLKMEASANGMECYISYANRRRIKKFLIKHGDSSWRLSKLKDGTRVVYVENEYSSVWFKGVNNSETNEWWNAMRNAAKNADEATLKMQNEIQKRALENSPIQYERKKVFKPQSHLSPDKFEKLTVEQRQQLMFFVKSGTLSVDDALEKILCASK
ncbi:hypothetical protein AAMO2058_000930000 [Amorphochlora amoebiformis]